MIQVLILASKSCAAAGKGTLFWRLTDLTSPDLGVTWGCHGGGKTPQNPPCKAGCHQIAQCWRGQELCPQPSAGSDSLLPSCPSDFLCLITDLIHPNSRSFQQGMPGNVFQESEYCQYTLRVRNGTLGVQQLLVGQWSLEGAGWSSNGTCN